MSALVHNIMASAVAERLSMLQFINMAAVADVTTSIQIVCKSGVIATYQEISVTFMQQSQWIYYSKPRLICQERPYSSHFR